MPKPITTTSPRSWRFFAWSLHSPDSASPQGPLLVLSLHRAKGDGWFCDGQRSPIGLAPQVDEDAPRQPPAQQRLSPRQQQTLDGLMLGRSEKEVAAELGLSPHTIHEYVTSLYRIFGVRSRGELLAKCHRSQALAG